MCFLVSWLHQPAFLQSVAVTYHTCPQGGALGAWWVET